MVAVGAVDGEEADAALGAGRNDDQVGGVAVDHEHLRAGQGVAVAALGGGQGDAGLVPLAARLGEREGGDGLAAGDAGQVRGLGGLVTAVDQRVRGEHDGAEERGAQQRAAHLLEHDAELDVAVARATELLGDDETLQAELLAHLAPHGGIETVLGLHLLAHGGFGGLGVEERRTVLRSSSCSSVKAKFMRAILRCRTTEPTQIALAYTCVHSDDGPHRDPRSPHRTPLRVVRRAEAGQHDGRHRWADRAGRPARSARPAAAIASARSTSSSPRVCSSRRDGDRRSPNDSTITVWGTLRLDRLLREIRG